MQSSRPVGAAGGNVQLDARAPSSGAAVTALGGPRRAASIAPPRPRGAGFGPQGILVAFLVAVALVGGLLSAQPLPRPSARWPTAAGAVTLSDDDSGSAMFDLAGMAPGDTASRCIRVTYAGEGDLAP